MSPWIQHADDKKEMRQTTYGFKSGHMKPTKAEGSRGFVEEKIPMVWNLPKVTNRL